MAGLEVSVVIPVYRSATSLRTLVERLLRVLEQTGSSHEIVMVEDSGGDGSWDVLRQLQAEEPDRIVAVELMRNVGQHNALMCGFRCARGEFIVTIDDDLQNPPEEIPKLLEAIRTRNLDLVYGAYASKKHSLWRNAGSALVNAFYRVVFKSDVTISSFRAMRRPLLESIFPYDLNFTFVDGLLAWNTQRIGQVEVEHRHRASGYSGYKAGKLIQLAFNLFTNFSLLPLRLVSWLGLALSCVGFFLALYYLIESLRGQIGVPGYASIIVAILVVGGAQLMSLGIMGEYLGRLHLNVNRKPQYTVRTLLGNRIGGPAVRCLPDDEAIEPVRPHATGQFRIDTPGLNTAVGNRTPSLHGRYDIRSSK
jgi:glycosyltransferase involved in cell wall biosynthesis